MTNMIREYVEYSGIDNSTVELNIQNSKKIVEEELYTKNLSESKNLIYDIIRYPFNNESSQIVGKYKLFSPYMINLILSSGYKSFIEYMGGVGVISEVIKTTLIDSKVTFYSINREISNFAKWRFQKIGLDISISNPIGQYDVIISDGFLQYLDSVHQEKSIVDMIHLTSKNGLLCLLIDISGKSIDDPLKNNVDIVKIHSILEQSDMVCIYGKNTFSSLWKKMI